MPHVLKYKKGSVIFFEGESRGNHVFLLKEGTLIRTKVSSITALPEQTRVRNGEFFGIKAGLGNFPRDETIQAIGDSVVYTFTPNEFLEITSKHLKILFKMLTALSNELRKIHLSVERSLGTQEESNERKLLSTAEYYEKNRKYGHAFYAFSKFQELYPEASDKEEIKEKIQHVKEMMVK